MAQRINISIPDELNEKMQLFKERLNISKLCQNAIQQAITIEELKDQTNDEYERKAVACKKEREDLGKGFREEGFKDGYKDVLHSNFFNMFQMSQHYPCSMSPKEAFQSYASHENTEKIESKKLETVLEDPFSGFEDVEDLYFEGWADGFRAGVERVFEKP